MARLFGTDGVRGIANKELTPQLAFKIGRAGAYVLTKSCTESPRILVGKDTRISGDMLENALVAGILSVGANAIIAGVIPTPAIAYLVRDKHFDAGVMISASHNPFEHNGIKFFNKDGFKLSDSIEDEIEKLIFNDEIIENPIGEKIGTSAYDSSLVDDYIDFAIKTTDCDFSGLTVALDCANGASSVTAKKAFEKLSAKVFVINDQPNGVNINNNCGSTHIEGLCEFVKNNKVDFGLAFDGDADRVLAVDENGELVDGDKIMIIVGLDMKNRGLLPDNTVVATVMSNLGFFKSCEKNNLCAKTTKVGDRYVLEEMLRCGHKIGGEQSGHVILLDNNTTGDGLVTGISLASAIIHSGKKLSSLQSVIKVYPQVLINAKVKNELKTEENYMKFDEIKSLYDLFNL